jgi:hypothetical protein
MATFLEAKKSLCRKLNIDFTDIANNDVFTLEDIEDFMNQGAMQAYDYEMWDFSEHSKTATLDSTDITNGYVPYPQDIQPSSIYYLTIGAKEFDKKTFSSYKKWFQQNPTDQTKLWSEFKRLIFFNTNIASAGQVIDIYGKRNFRVMSADGDLLPFSPDTDNEEMSGNQACILLAYAEALDSEKKKNPAQATIERQKAYSILSIISANLKQGRANEQVKNRPMFDVPNMFGRNSGNRDVGTFNI